MHHAPDRVEGLGGALREVPMRIRTRLRWPRLTTSFVPAFWSALVLSALLAPSLPLFADDVHLTNGNTFKGVIATLDGDQVRIRLPHGEIALPASRVDRIDKHESALEDYLARERTLFSRDATAADWLELARWALRHDLGHGARESALRAARIDPRLEGLAEVLGDFGYLYDEELGRWLTYDESMERRGYVYYGGGWVHRSDLEERLRTMQEEQARRREARRTARAEAQAQLALEAAFEARVQAEVAREVARAAVQQPGLIHGVPAVVGSFFLPVVHHATHPRGGAHRPAPREAAPSTTQRSPQHTHSAFTPPAGQSLEQRDFGGGLGVNLPNGYGGAPGRLRHRP